MANLRISGGTFRGRKIPVPEGVRPTGSRVREALFSIWRERLSGARFLDLFAGAGAVGLEALGRGAEEVVLVEARPIVARRLADTCRKLGAEGCHVVVAELPEALAKPKRLLTAPFDLVFADPPYGFDAWTTLFEVLRPLLAAGAAVAVEHGEREEPPVAAGGLQAGESRRYGETRLTFFEN